jgi:hypothetical protein
MEPDQKAPPKSLDYGAGALVVLVASLGVAAIAYSLPLLPFNLFNLPAWIFGPLGIYTLAYSLIARKDSTYYLVWGSIMFAIALVSALYTAISPFIILGILAIVIAIIGIVAYQRSKK